MNDMPTLEFTASFSGHDLSNSHFRTSSMSHQVIGVLLDSSSAGPVDGLGDPPTMLQHTICSVDDDIHHFCDDVAFLQCEFASSRETDLVLVFYGKPV